MKENLSQAAIEPLLSYFDRLIPLNKEEKELVIRKFHPRLYRKRQYLLNYLSIKSTTIIDCE